MVDIKNWIVEFANKVEQIFDKRVWFIGLQGSYGRGEATDKSDIDVVVILDEVSINDLKIYRDMLNDLPYRELVCGFISGKNELLNWDTSDLFQFYYDTTPIKGTLDSLADKIDRQAVKRAIHKGACNIYHTCVHNFVHEKSDDILRSLYKSSVFVLQALYFYERGKFIKSIKELQKLMNHQSELLNTAIALKNGSSVQFEEMSTLLLDWAIILINKY